MKKMSFVTLLIIGCVLILEPLSAAKINATRIGSKINVYIDDKFFTSYVFSSDEEYPFFFPVNGPLSGGSVTSMRNSAYPHHTSLFFGTSAVNGIDFFDYIGGLDKEGKERGRIISVNAEIIKQGGDSVVISDECIWSCPGALSPIKDTRKITITAPSASIYQIDFEITLDMLVDVHIGKTGHSIFCGRIASDLTVQNGGTMINAEGMKNEKENWGVKSAWIDYFGKRGSVVEGMTIMQHPSNPWYPSPFFARDYGFFAPCPMNWPENGKETFMKKGEKRSFRFRVLAHGGDYAEAKIAEAFEKFRNEK